MNGFTVIDNTTGHYPDCEKIALTEDWAKHLIYCDIDTFAINEDGNLILIDDCGNCAFCPADRFTVVFEKQIPKKPIEDRYPWCICPNCRGSVYLKHIQEHIGNEETTYCEHCGQALDWSDTE